MSQQRKVVKKSTLIKAVKSVQEDLAELESVINEYEVLDDNDRVFEDTGKHNAVEHCGGGSKD